MTVNHNEYIQTYTPPLPSLALREIPLRSRASSRGEMVDTNPITGERYISCYESGIELAGRYQLRANPNVIEIREQYPAIKYINPLGQQKTHICDLYATTKDGLRIAFVAKSHRYVARNDFIKELKCIEAARPKSLVDEVRLLTDRHYTRGFRLNNQRLVTMSKCISDQDYFNFVKTLKSLKFQGMLGELIRKLELGKNGFILALKSVFDGYLNYNLDEEFGLWSKVETVGGVQ